MVTLTQHQEDILHRVSANIENKNAQSVNSLKVPTQH